MLPRERTLALVFALLILSGPARAQSAGAAYGAAEVLPPGAHMHDGGYLRLQLGFDWTGVSAHAAGTDVDYDGWGGSLAVALGISVGVHQILYLEVLDAGAWDGIIDGSAGRPSMGTDVIGIGPGTGRYFGPNLFVAGTALFAVAQLTDDDGNAIESSRLGFAL
jgi:hypothetical protein